MRLSILIIAVSCLCPSAWAADSPLQAEYLRCEYRVDPLGIDQQQPRLSWIVAAGQRGQRQTAYQILVAGSQQSLQQDRGDLWDTGKVPGDETIGTAYGGKPLTSHQRCFWKVKVWDKDDKPSAWSPAAIWSMGLLQPSDWQAAWIGFDKPRKVDLPDAPFEGAKWIWHAADKQAKAPKGYRLFLSTLQLPENVQVKKAELLVTADDTYKFVINTHLVVASEPRPDSWKQPRLVDVKPQLKPGANSLRVEVFNAEEGPAGLLAKLVVTTSDGKTFTHVSDGSWKSTDNPGANWHNRPIDAESWPAARVLGDYGMQPWGKLKYVELVLPPPPYLRASFQCDKPVRRATVYATALGIFDLHLNGQRISDDHFNPGWTDYTKRVYYRAYDVTDRLERGENVLGAILADGWYSGYLGWQRIRDHYGKQPRLRAQLRIEYADGTSAVIGTGPTWKAATGPIREADFLMGETCDARLAIGGWDRPGFDDRAWEAVDVSAEVQPLVQAHPGPAVRPFAELKAVKVTEPKPGAYVFDLGQNFAGVARLAVSGEPGQKITLRFAERLNPDGTIYTTNLRSARATDTYICRGGGVEVWQPRLTFHGFQYVEVTGLKQPPTKETIVGVALSSDTPVAGRFTWPRLRSFPGLLPRGRSAWCCRRNTRCR